MNTRPLFATLVAAALALPLAAQQTPLVVARRSGPIELDGRPDEPAWRLATPLPMVMYLPNSGATPTQHTDARITYDERYIYVAARLYDTAPDAIQAFSMARDEDLGGDFFNIMIDPYNDNENGHTFSTTPAGARLDYIVANDAEGPSAASSAWNGLWDNAVHRDSTGWAVEVRIPFSTLRYESRDGRIVMGLIVNRLIGRSQERSIFPPIAPDRPFAPFKPSRGRDVMFAGVPPRRPLVVTPYAAAGVAQWPGPDTGSVRREAGLDVRFGVTNNLNLDLTVNTDFAEVEGDDERVNLTRFPLFFPERRQFFLERAGVFEFTQGGVDRLFHSRRIGLTDAGEPVRLLGGIRLVGRAAGWDLGLAAMQAAQSGTRAAENLAVTRLRRRVFNEFSAVGAMFTSRVRADGSYNLALGVDGAVRLSAREDYARVTYARSLTSPDSAAAGDGTDHLRLALERRATAGLGYNAVWTDVAAAYEPGLGFVERRGITRADLGTSYGVLLPDARLLRLLRPGVSWTVTWSDSTQRVASSIASALLRFESRIGAVVELRRDEQLEELTAPFALSSSAGVPAGRYGFGGWYAALTLPPGWRLSGQAQAQSGRFYDGTVTSATLAPEWFPSARFNLGLEYQRVDVDFAARAEQFSADVLRVRARAYATTRLSTVVFAQLNTAANVVTANLRVRYAFREGTDLWIVGNYVSPARHASLPVVTGQTSLLVKYALALRP